MHSVLTWPLPGGVKLRIQLTPSWPCCRPPFLAQMKEWLGEHGYEGDVWELAQRKGKKADYEAVMRKALGQ